METTKPGRWIKWGARFFDFFIHFCIVWFITLFSPIDLDFLGYAWVVLAAMAIWPPLEAFWLSTCGTTLGKALFGLAVRDVYGHKLTLRQAFQRTFFFGRGRPGVLIPIHRRLPRYIVGVTVLLCCLGVTGYQLKNAPFARAVAWSEQDAEGGWIRFYSPQGRFVADFPSSPAPNPVDLYVAKANQSINYNQFKTAKVADVSYGVSYLKFPSKWKFAGYKKILEGVLDVLVEADGGGRLLQKRLTRYGKYRSMDYLMQGEEGVVVGRLIVIGTTLYNLTVECPRDQMQFPTHSDFLNSFYPTS